MRRIEGDERVNAHIQLGQSNSSFFRNFKKFALGLVERTSTTKQEAPKRFVPIHEFFDCGSVSLVDCPRTFCEKYIGLTSW